MSVFLHWLVCLGLATFAVFLPVCSQAATYKCTTETNGFGFNLTSADVAALPGTELGTKDWNHREICIAEMLEGDSPDLSDFYLTADVSSDGYAKITPGLSVRIHLGRSVSWNNSMGTELRQNLEMGNIGASWPYAPAWAFKRLERKFKITYSIQYYLRRESGDLKPGIYDVPMAQVRGPTGTHTWTIKVNVPGATCKVKTPVKTVKLGTAKGSDLALLKTGQLYNPGTKFNIEFDCRNFTDLSLTLHDSHAAGAADRLELAPASTAAGVAIAITASDTDRRVRTGETIPVRIGKSQTAFSPEFTANLVRTGDAVAPGLVRATATFTLDYK